MGNKRLTIKEAVQLLNKLLECNEKRTLLIQTDSISTFDIINKYAEENKAYLVRRKENEGKIKSHHKILVDSCLSYNHHSNGLVIDSLLHEMSLYERENASVVFLVEGCHDINNFPKNLELFECYNPDALTVGDLVDAFEEISDKFIIAYCRNNNILTDFVSPSAKIYHNQFVVVECIDNCPYNVSNFIQFLLTFDRQLPICFSCSEGYGFAYDIQTYKGDTHSGKISHIVIECETPNIYIQNL